MDRNGLSADTARRARRGTAYGNYIRNSPASTYVNCACGSPYRTWSIDVNASGVPYDGSNVNNLNVIYRGLPATAPGNTVLPSESPLTAHWRLRVEQ